MIASPWAASSVFTTGTYTLPAPNDSVSPWAGSPGFRTWSYVLPNVSGWSTAAPFTLTAGSASEIAAALTLSGPSVTALVDTGAADRTLTGALTLAGPTVQAAAAVRAALEAGVLLAGPEAGATLSQAGLEPRTLTAGLLLGDPAVAAQLGVRADLSAALSLAPHTVQVSFTEQETRELAAALALPGPALTAVVGRPPRLARLRLRVTDALALRLEAADAVQLGLRGTDAHSLTLTIKD